jgi:uncharacterized membrane protein YesL
LAKKALQILLQSVLDIWDNLLTLTLANMFWSVSILPMLAALSFVPGFPGFVLAGILGALIGAPVAIALVAATVDVSRLERVEFGEITRNLKYYYKRAWVVGALNAVFLILAIFNLIFYSTAPGIAQEIRLIITVVIFFALFIWFTMQMYMLPLVVRMEKLTVKGLLRNTLLANFKYPALSLILGAVLALLMIASLQVAFVPVIIIGMAFYALVANKALSAVLERERNHTAVAENARVPLGTTLEDVADVPEKEPEPEAIYSTRNAPPGVKRRGVDKK